MATIMQHYRETLLRLSSAAQEQENYLRQLGTAPSTDELALEFSDALGVVHEKLNEEARSASSRLDRYLEEMSGSKHAELWTVDALHVAPEWARVRQLAHETLHILDDAPNE